MRDDRTIGDDATEEDLGGDEAYCPACGHAFSPMLERCPDDGTRLIVWRASADPLIATILDERYRIVRPLGSGGMGTVYEAVQLSIERTVAIKVVRDELASDRSTVKRFLREARLLVQLNHHNIVAVYDCGQTAEGILFLVMELLRGPTLATLIARAHRLPAVRACEIALQLCDALAAAHDRNIVHRDLKPENVVVGDELVKVLDFGLAKSLARDASAQSGITQAGTVIGTPLYMAPEAISGDRPDPRSDLYALGCLVFEMLAGDPPFLGDKINVILGRHLREPVPALPADVPPALVELVHALLAKQADARPQSAHVVRQRLAAVLAGEAPDDEAPTLIHTPRVARGTEPPPPATPPAIRSTLRHSPPPPAPVQTAAPSHKTEILPNPPRRLLPFVLMVLVLAIAAFVAAVIALGP